MTCGVTDPAVVSSAPGIEWPAVPTAAGASILSLQFQLEQSQWWTGGELLALQFRQLRELIAHAVVNVPRWRGRDASLADSPQAFAAWPVLKKAELLGAPAAFCATTWPVEQGGVTVSETSGSGRPGRIRFTKAAAALTHALVVRHLLWHGFDLTGKMAAIHPEFESRRWPNWGGPLAAAFHTGPAATLNIATDVDRQLDWVIGERPDYLQTRPSNLRALLLRSRETGRAPPSLRAVVVQSEAMAPDLRLLARKLWAVPIIDTYSCGEFGAIALQCPADEQYHVQSESVYVEVLREDSTPCPPGEIGRVVVTSLHNFAMPLIRYELGDYAVPGEPCSCGRGLPTLARVVGRERNMAVDPSGRRFWPSLPASLFLDVVPIKQFRLVQRSPETVEILYVLDRPLSGSEQGRLSQRLTHTLGYAYRFEYQQVRDIPRMPGDKYEDFVSLLDGD